MMQERKPHRIEQRAAAFSSQAENRESGQNLLEFAAVLALALVFLFAAVEISSVFQQKSDLDNMVRQAAQQAGEFGGGKDEVEAFIRKQMEYQGYSNQSISAAVGTLELEAQTFDESNKQFIAKPGIDTCTYGEFITVSIAVQGEIDIPQIFFMDQIEELFVLTVEKTSRCWRA